MQAKDRGTPTEVKNIAMTAFHRHAEPQGIAVGAAFLANARVSHATGAEVFVD